VPLVEQELLTLQEHLSCSPSLFSGVRVTRSLVVCPFVLFLLTIVMSVLLRFMDSDYHSGIFKLLYKINIKNDNIYSSITATKIDIK
jgi:hypothetical protein